MPIIVLDPVQAPLADQPGATLAPAPRLSTLSGKTLGLWSNQKLNATKLLEMMRIELAKQFAFEVRSGIYDPGNLMQVDGWGAVDECDAVILANGDCGACSTSGIVNAIELEKRGIPTLLVSTPPFLEAVKMSAKLRGMPDIRWAVVDHPVAMLDATALQARALDATKQFFELMLQPTSQRAMA